MQQRSDTQKDVLKVPVYSLDGKKTREITLPDVFNYPLEPDIIRRAVLAIRSSSLQKKGVKPGAGMKVAEYRGRRSLPPQDRGINVGHARLPRLKNRGSLLASRVGNVPQAVGGRAAHPPKVEKIIVEKINKKEKKKALMSAIAYTKDIEAVSKRHKIPRDLVLPVVVENSFENLKKTKEVLDFFSKIGLAEDIEYAKEKTKTRAGKGKLKGRRIKKKKSLLVVTSKECPAYKAARNLVGVDIVPVRKLNAELLAPGGHPGRLTVWSEDAIKKVSEWLEWSK
ncbi:MAG: 50S ribosomal protein L4 [Candidatus Diapherotrites archaeon]